MQQLYYVYDLNITNDGRSQMPMPRRNAYTNTDKVGWRVNEWADDCGLGRAYTYLLIRDNRIKSVKVGGARVIVTSLADYLRSLADDDL